ELIRTQIELAHLPQDHERAAELRWCEGELLERHLGDWLEELPHFEGISWREFHRGFIDTIWADSVAAFLRASPALFAAAPLRSARVRVCDEPDGLRMLADSLYLLRLRELNLGDNDIGYLGAVTLTASPNVANLTSLLLHANSLADVGVVVLSASQYLAGLTE